MTQVLHVTLLRDWTDESHLTPQGPRTYYRKPSRCGPLQVSLWSRNSNDQLTFSPQDLERIAADFGEEQFECGPAKQRSNGTCAFGNFGTAEFSAPPDRSFGQVWILSDRRDLVLATYMSAETPDPAEVVEARMIVSQITPVKPTVPKRGR